MPNTQTGPTDQRQAKNGRPLPPAISLPKGGGAIRGMGEKFAANPATGTGSMTVPIATSPGRSGFGPQLSLSYDSGSGNGPFGLGWSLGLPSITRKTDKGLPQYRDAEESDEFILSGAEDLVPVLVQDGQGHWGPEVVPPRTVGGNTYTLQRYRPRIEGLFARIERWTNQADPEDVFWRSISKDNITTWYGTTEESRIADPTDKTRIFSWLMCESHDDKGNLVVYTYKPEDSTQVELCQAHERNRTEQSRSANRYLKRIRYGNHTPYVPQLLATQPWPAFPGDKQWFFEVVFDYGEHDPHAPTPDDAGLWDHRKDPFSSYRAGFELRTYRLCQRVLMFHHFPNEPAVGQDCLVRSTDLTYAYEQTPADPRNPIHSVLTAVTQSGYTRQANQSYLKKSLPPLEFAYSQATIHDHVHVVDAASVENLPSGLDNIQYQWVDLDGEGLSGVLTEQAEGWFYKENLSPINIRHENGIDSVEPQFGPLELIAEKPSLAAISSGGQQLLDLAGDGQLDVVALAGPAPGFYERTHDGRWEPFRPFASLPNLDWNNPNLKFVDLTGDGHADILISEDDVFCWHASLAEAGFGPSERVRTACDEEKGPRIVFADGTQSMYLSDMSGDGLTDIVRIRNGEVCYWPNLGYGRFGAKVTMDDAPWFDTPDLFDHKRIHLADIDGSGVTDIVYLSRDGVRLYFNQSGNSWSVATTLTDVPPTDNLKQVTVVDLSGNGTACLVWSSPLPADARQPMHYLDLLGGQKPHLLEKLVNNLGAETRVHYAPSTKFYLADKRDGKPWITKIPFPVHVVERVEIYDRISRNRFVSRYAYHHGYFDGIEREFRGFGRVDQWDTEEFAAFEADGLLADAENLDQASHVPPVLTRTWFHTGVYRGRGHISDFFAGLLDGKDVGEYYREPGLSDAQARTLLLDDTILPDDMTVEEEREVCRALKGSMLCQEVYALDGTDKGEQPYTVTEQNFTLQRLQPQAGNRHAVFFTHAREAINYHYERIPADPRISHTLTLEVDAYGNVLKEVAIGYGRRPGQTTLQGEDKQKQEQMLVAYTEHDVTNPIDDPTIYSDAYRTPLPCETRTYEVTGATPAGSAVRFSFKDLADKDFQALLTLPEVAYEQPTDYTKQQKRLIECARTLYRRDNLSGLLDKGELQPLGLPGESYTLAFTPGLLNLVYVRNGQTLLPANPADVLEGGGTDRGGYVDLDGDGKWWIPSGRVFYSPNSADNAVIEFSYARLHFFLARRYRDPFHTAALSTESFVTYDSYDLLMVETRDAVGNRVTVGARNAADKLTTPGNDYRVLQPSLVTDSNRNRTAVAFDAFGLVVGTAVMGKHNEPDGQPKGDSLTGFVPNMSQVQLDAFIVNPRESGLEPSQSVATQIVHDLLGQATSRIVYDLERFQRTGQPPFAAVIARETHVSDLPPGQRSKLQLSVSYSDGFGREIQQKVQAEPGSLVKNGPVVSPRWVGSGWTIFNNKGQPVRQYEPFFDDTHDFKFGNKVGVSPILFYDPLERVVATLHPNHTYEKLVFDPWQQETWDVNDTVTFDPRTDPDIYGYVAKYFEQTLSQTAGWKTWLQQRGVDPLAPPKDTPTLEAEKKAAVRTLPHADTPTIVCFDTLGRPFLTVVHNKLKRRKSDGTVETVAEKYPTRIYLDIEGNQREVRDGIVQAGDQQGRIVMRYDYDMLGNRIHQSSMEAGKRWMLNDITGNLIRVWDSRGHNFKTAYDALRRPIHQFVRGTDAAHSDPRTFNQDILFEKTEYGEGQANDVALNLRTRVYRQFDGAGAVTNLDCNLIDNQDEAYDFKGNLLRSSRTIADDYKKLYNWSVDIVQQSWETYSSSTTYDALNRPLTVTAPDGSIYRSTFNEANLLDKVDVNLRGAAAATPFVTNVNYNAKGQRERIVYGNGGQTIYGYDPLTFRLTHLETRRPAGLNGLGSQIFTDPTVVQDLRYTYDPVGNIACIEDTALKTLFHSGQQVAPVSNYTYDALYRLIEAQGREHIGQTAFGAKPPNGNYRDQPFIGLSDFVAHPNDTQKLRNYTERYAYDAVGNFKEMQHLADGGAWTRHYNYEEASLLEASKQSNRLTRTSVGGTTETYSTGGNGYDVHGNMLHLPHLAQMVWDFEDQLQQIDLGGGGAAYYVYDASGQRVRKVVEAQNGTRRKERLYLSGLEIYREYNGSGVSTTLERETLHVLDDQQRIALVETKTHDTSLPRAPNATPLLRYQLSNHLGSVSLELAEDAALISYEEYHPYGTAAFQAGRSSIEVSLKRYRYTGKERDDETGFSYHGARYYVGWLGRWTSADPAGLDDGLNPYGYVQANPISFADRDGHESSRPDIPLNDPPRIRYPSKHPEKQFWKGVAARHRQYHRVYTEWQRKNWGRINKSVAGTWAHKAMEIEWRNPRSWIRQYAGRLGIKFSRIKIEERVVGPEGWKMPAKHDVQTSIREVAGEKVKHDVSMDYTTSKANALNKMPQQELQMEQTLREAERRGAQGRHLTSTADEGKVYVNTRGIKALSTLDLPVRLAGEKAAESTDREAALARQSNEPLVRLPGPGDFVRESSVLEWQMKRKQAMENLQRDVGYVNVGTLKKPAWKYDLTQLKSYQSFGLRLRDFYRNFLRYVYQLSWDKHMWRKHGPS